MCSFTHVLLRSFSRWCSYLDSITEELEEERKKDLKKGGSGSIQSEFDGFQFITKKELENLTLTHLIGTAFLKPHMHGYYMDRKLYTEAKAVLDPFAYDRWRKNNIQKK